MRSEKRTKSFGGLFQESLLVLWLLELTSWLLYLAMIDRGGIVSAHSLDTVWQRYPPGDGLQPVRRIHPQAGRTPKSWSPLAGRRWMKVSGF